MVRRALGLLPAILLAIFALPTVAAQAAGTLSLSPASVAPGYSPQTITIIDSSADFTASSPPPVFVLQGGSPVASIVSNVQKVSSSQLSFTLGSGLSTGTYAVEVEVGSSPYPEATLNVQNPSFALSTSQLDVGYSAQTVAVSGTYTAFNASTTVEVLSGGSQVSGAVSNVVANSQTSLSFTLAAGLAAGTYQVQVSGISGTQTLKVVQPSVTLSKTSQAAGYTGAVQVTATGTNTNFSNATTVTFVSTGGTSSPATNVSDSSATSLGFDLPSSLAAGSYTVKFVTGSSETDSSFTVTAQPTISISPGTLRPGYSQSTITVTGTDTDFSGSTTTVSVLSGGTQYASGFTATSATQATFTLATGLAANSYTVAVTQSGYPEMDATLQVNAATLAFSNTPPAQLTAGGVGTSLTVVAEQSGIPTTVTSPLAVSASATGSATVTPASATIATGSSTTGSFTLTDTRAETVTVTFTASGYASVSANVTFVAGAPSKLVFGSVPSSTTDAQTVSVPLLVEDANGNAAAVTTSTQPTLGATSGGSADGNLSGGPIAQGASSATLTYTPAAPGTVTLTAAASGLASASPATIDVLPGSPSRIVVSPQSATLTSGQDDPITITLEDSRNHSASYSTSKTLAVSTSVGTLYSDSGLTTPISGGSLALPANQGSTTIYLASNVGGTANVTVSLSGLPNGSASVTVNAPGFTISPATVDAGYSDTTVTVSGQNTSFGSSTTVTLYSGTTAQAGAVTGWSASGPTAATFTLKSGLGQGTYRIQISGVSQVQTMTVIKKSLGYLSTPPTQATVGQSVTLQVAAEQNGTPSSVPSDLAVQASVSGSATVNGSSGSATATISAGTSAQTFTITDATAQNVTVTFSATGYQTVGAAIDFVQSGGSSSGGSTGGSSGNSGGGGVIPPPVPSQSVDATSDVTASQADGVTTLTLNPQSLSQTLTAGAAQTVTLRSSSDTSTLVVPAAAMQAMTSAKDQLSLVVAGSTFSIPLADSAFAKAAKTLGAASAGELQLSVSVAPAAAKDDSSLVGDFGQSGILAPAQQFTVTVSANGKSLTVDQFAEPVGRTFQMSSAVNPLDATGVVLVNGVPEHAWTTFSGNTATVYSRTDSTYAVVKQHLDFQDLAGVSQTAAIEALSNKLVTNGVTSTTFDPAGGVTRAQFAALLIRALGLWNIGDNLRFSDVSSSYWAASVIKPAVAEQFIQGYPDGTFRPGHQITNEQMAAMVARVMGFLNIGEGSKTSLPSDYGQIPAWVQADVKLVLSQGIMTTDSNGAFRPADPTTRAQAAQIIWNLMQKANIE